MNAKLERLAVHTHTTKPLSLEHACVEYSQRQIPGISVWVEALADYKTDDAAKMIQDHGLKVPALVRGGFFCAETLAEREAAVDHNRELIDIAQKIDAEMLVLVVGAIPKVDLKVQRGWVSDAIEQLDDQAKQAGVKIAIEPLHPMYAGDKSCVNRMMDARLMCESLQSDNVGVAVDVYHIWWDPDLKSEIALIGQMGALYAFHLCDWRVPTRDLLTDRALMGDGCIDLTAICQMVEQTGFDGWMEVEIFSDEHWARDQGEYLDQIIERYLDLI
ncbi:MAG: sugar phosphate isomerase/epimerase family protein [Planctomycetota bacterium]